MFTRCSSCRAAFSITDQQLAIASGMVRCGVCEHVFDARLYLFKQAQERKNEEVEAKLDAVIDAELDVDIIEYQQPVSTQESDNGHESQIIEQRTAEEPPDVPKIIADQLSNLERDSNSSHPIHLLGFLLIGLLLTAISIQVIAVYQVDLLPPSLHTKVCSWITCVHKVPRALDKFEILNRSIYTHPQEKNALMVTVTIINRADFAQPYPIVQLRFLDVAGDVMAARQFNPSDYLNVPWRPQTLMQPARPISILLEVVDFGEDVVGYEFDFL